MTRRQSKKRITDEEAEITTEIEDRIEKAIQWLDEVNAHIEGKNLQLAADSRAAAVDEYRKIEELQFRLGQLGWDRLRVAVKGR